MLLCPISMTYAVTPALRDNPAIYRDWAPQLTARAYDPALKIWREGLILAADNETLVNTLKRLKVQP